MSLSRWRRHVPLLAALLAASASLLSLIALLLPFPAARHGSRVGSGLVGGGEGPALGAPPLERTRPPPAPAGASGPPPAPPAATTATTGAALGASPTHARSASPLLPLALPGAPAQAPQSALCVVGGVRSFYYRRVHESIRVQVFERLAPARVFFVLSRTKSIDEGGEGNGMQTRDTVPEERLQAALATFGPDHVEIHNSSTCETALRAYPGRFCCDDGQVEMFMQLYWIRRCLEVAHEREAVEGFRFRLFVRVRPDVYYYSPFPAPPELLQNGVTLAKRSWDRPADWVFATTRDELAVFYESFAPLLDECESKRWCPQRRGACWHTNLTMFSHVGKARAGFEFTIWGEERPAGTHLAASGRAYRFKSVDVMPVIVRAPHAADCRRLISWKMRMKCGRQTQHGWDT